MKITGENSIAADEKTVWAGLNDPEILRQSIPGCESLEQVGANSFKATVTTRIGPITAKFNGNVELTDLDPPNGYTLIGAGSAGPMGSAKGAAKVKLVPHGGGTKLTYDIDADITGKLAQLGGRLIQGTVNMLAGQFFTRFGELVASPTGTVAPASRAAPSLSVATWLLLAAALAAAVVALWYFR